MVEIFSNFTTTLVIVGLILALGIVFEKQLIALEDKFDAWVSKKRSQRKERKNEKRTTVSSHCYR